MAAAPAAPTAAPPAATTEAPTAPSAIDTGGGALPLLEPTTDAAVVAAAAAIVAAETAAASLPLPASSVATVSAASTVPVATAPPPTPAVAASAPAIDFSALSWRFLEEWKGEGSPGRLTSPLPPFQEQASAGKRSIDVASSDRRTVVATHSLYSRVAGGAKVTAATAGPEEEGAGGVKGNGEVAAGAGGAEAGMSGVGLTPLSVSPLPATGKASAKRPRNSSGAERCVTYGCKVSGTSRFLLCTSFGTQIWRLKRLDILVVVNSRCDVEFVNAQQSKLSFVRRPYGAAPRVVVVRLLKTSPARSSSDPPPFFVRYRRLEKYALGWLPLPSRCDVPPAFVRTLCLSAVTARRRMM